MRVSFADRPALVLGVSALVAGLALASPVAAQGSREVVSKSVSVGRDGSTLELEFASGPALAIALSEGEVRIGDDVVGRYQAGDALDGAWRSLLGFAVALDDGPLARMLVDWSPPEGLEGRNAELAARIDEALESALAQEAATPPPPPSAPEVGAGPAEAIALRSLVSLLDRTEALSGLADALDDLDLDDIRLSIGEDLTIGEDVDVDGSVLVVDGDLEIEGRVRGDVVVIDGDVRLAPGSRVDGDVRYVEGTVIDQGGRVEGSIVRVDRSDVELERRIRDEIRTEIRNEIRSATRVERESRNRPSVFGRVFGGIGGAMADLFSVLVIGLLGAVVVHFAGPNLDAVAETARRTPGRALAVGTAGAFLTLPAFVLGIVALAISIVGIPALILWIPLFPVAVVLAGGLGYLAVARNVGIWAARQRFPYMGWVRLTNPVTLVAGGALVLAIPFIAGDLVGVVPWTGALEVLLKVVGFMAGTLAVLMGFGAVLLTRAGRKPEFFDDDLFGGWGSGGRRSPGGPGTGPAGTADADMGWAEAEVDAAMADAPGSPVGHAGVDDPSSAEGSAPEDDADPTRTGGPEHA